MNKKRKIIFSVIMLFFMIYLIIDLNYYKNLSVKENINFKSEKIDFLSMMLETEAKSGKYKEVTSEAWPSDDYVFNENLSGCENGGDLKWDDATKKVIMEGNSSDKRYVYFDKIPTFAQYVASLYTGKQGENNLYYHNGTIKSDDGTVLDANDNSYRFSGGDYELTNKAIVSGLTRVDSSSNTTTNGVINFYCNGTRQYVGYSCSSSYTSYYTLQYDVTFTQYPTHEAALNKAVYDEYLTKPISNFVCFGYDSKDGSCPTDNLYRIIGVFDGKVKLIKYDYAKSTLLGTDGSYYSLYADNNYNYGNSKGYNSKKEIGGYYWNSTESIVWGSSTLLKTNLNTNFLTNIKNGTTTDWGSKISEHQWIVNGNTVENILNVIPSISYQNEINTDGSKTMSSQIGLMYVNDYTYAASPTSWTSSILDSSNNGNDYRQDAIKNKNWMYMGLEEWTITYTWKQRAHAFFIGYSGYVSYGCVIGNHSSGRNDCYYNFHRDAIRPVFYLKPEIKNTSGNGTKDLPFIIK